VQALPKVTLLPTSVILCCFFASTFRCFFASTLRHCCFFTTTLRCFFTTTPRCFFSTLRCFFVIAWLLHYNTALLLHYNTTLQHFVASSLLLHYTVLLLRLATLICLQLLGSLIRLSQFYFVTVTYFGLAPFALLFFHESSPFFFFLLIFFFLLFTFQVCNQSSSSSWFFVSSLIMVVFVDSSKTPKNQFITILSHADKPIEEGITLVVLPSASFIYSSSPIDVSRTPHLSQWWSESSHELYDPSKRDSHPVQTKIFFITFFPPFRC
jgi:hypothetical protein